VIVTNQSVGAAKKAARPARKASGDIAVRDRGAEPEGYTTSVAALRCRASTVLLVKRCGDILETNFPGWAWAISPDERGGVITIRSMRLDARYGYLLHIAKIQDDVQLKAVLRAGGELLERAGVPRGKYKYEAWAAARRNMGLVAFDVADKDARFRRRYRDEAFTAAVKSGKVKVRVVDRKTDAGTQRQIYIGENNAS
jgi:hypothetical protein